MRKPFFSKGEQQRYRKAAYQCKLISLLVIRWLKCTISRFKTLYSDYTDLVAEQNGVFFQDYFTHIVTSQSVGGAKREYPGKPPGTPASRTWLVSHVASAGLEPTPVTAVI